MKYNSIAIFGGSFDPPHLGHIGIIDFVLKHFVIDRLIVLVAYRNPFKEKIRLEPSMRLACMQKLTSEYSCIECSDYEISKNKPIQSVESILHFWNLYKPKTLYFIIGEDNLEKLPTWDGFEIFRDIVIFIVLSRNLSNNFNVNKYNDLAITHKIKLHYMQFLYDISSTDIVSNIEKFKAFIPEAVRDRVCNSLHS